MNRHSQILCAIVAAGAVAAMWVTAASVTDATPCLVQRAHDRVTRSAATQRVDQSQSSLQIVQGAEKFRDVPEANTRGVRKATASESAAVPALYGTVIQAGYNSPLNNNWGVYEVPTSDAASFELVAGDIEAKFSATLIGNMLYVPAEEEVMLGIFYSVASYNVDDDYAFVSSNTVSNDHFKARCTAPDLTEPGWCYGCFYNGNSGYNFSRVNYVNRQETVIKSIGTQWQLCAINAEGDLYAIDSQKRLYQVDKSTGEQTQVATLSGVNFSRFNAGCFDPKTGTMYITTSDSYTGAKGGLYALDVSNGELTLIREFTGGEVLSSLFIPQDNVAANAPAAATDLALDFAGGSLAGNVSFTMPATYYDGSVASGAFHYSISVDGVEAAAGVEVAGGRVSRGVTVATQGVHKFEVTCFNANGNGPKVKTRAYIGTDAPLAVTNVNAVLNGDKIAVSWDAASGAVNGGYVDPEAVTYTVVRRPDGAVVAQGTSETSITVDAAVPEGEIMSYTFEVAAEYDGHTSETATSNAVVLGCIVPPHNWTFGSNDDLAGTTILDENGDGNKWTIDTYSEYMSIRYNSKLAMDDWFILPPVKLQSGYSYQLSYKVRCSSARYSEHLEVKLGDAPTVDAMTQTVTERYEIAETEFSIKTAKITVNADGLCYIGFHGCSDPDRNKLFLSEITISAGAAPVAPQGVSDLSVTPDADGHNNVEISFVTPLQRIDGSDLSSCDILVKRDDAVVTSIRGVAAGEHRSYTDHPETGGTYTYSVVPVANDIEGETSSATVFVGLKAPSPVTNVTVNETASDGEVTVGWTAPATDVEGNRFNSSLVRYNVYFIDGVNDPQLVGDNISELSLTHRVNDGTTQALALYLVEAVTDGGKAPAVSSEAIAVGKAYGLPYADSFAAGGPEFIYGTRSLNGTNRWMTLNDATVDIISSVDDDDAFLAVQQSGNQACGEFFTGKIALGDVAAPVLSFYTFNTLDDAGAYPDLNTIEVLVRADGAWQSVETVVVSETGEANRWNKVFVPLADFAGKNIQIALRVTCNTYLLTTIDALRVAREDEHNLAVESLRFPGEIFAGKPATYVVTIDNRGMNRAESFKVDLLFDGEGAHTADVTDALAAGHKTQLSFTHSFDEASTDSHTVEARVVMAEDQNEADNSSGVKPLTVDPSIFPVATGLSAIVTDGKVLLTWDSPDMSLARREAVTEDFEGYEAFDRNPAGWTMVDRDGGAIGGFRNITLPGIAQGSQQSFWVSEASEEVFGDAAGTFLGHNSLKYLMQLYITDTDVDGNPLPCDDWAISPELSGYKQTISLWARSYAATMPESFEILWSDGSTDPDDFVSAAVFADIPAPWRMYEVQIPEGARRFALRCISKDRFSFLADDFTFIPADGPQTLSLKGYDIFCDGEHVGESTDATFEAPIPHTDGRHSYAVRAIFDQGVSAMSAPAYLDYSALDDIREEGVEIIGCPGLIIVNGATGQSLSIANVAGIILCDHAAAPAHVEIPLPPGVYLVTVANVTRKLTVR